MHVQVHNTCPGNLNFPTDHLMYSWLFLLDTQQRLAHFIVLF